MNELNYSILTAENSSPGVTLEKDGAVFTAEGYGELHLLLYPAGSEVPVLEIPFPQPSEDGFCRMKIRMAGIASYEYNFSVDGTVMQDPYAKGIAGRDIYGEVPDKNRIHSIRCRMTSSSFRWKEDKLPEIRYEDGILYQLHVRGYTMHPKSGVRHPGTFAGLKEKIPYLKQLGINMIRLMPIYDYPEMTPRFSGGPEREVSEEFRRKLEEARAEDERSGRIVSSSMEDTKDHYRMNYWGYGSGFYFAPKASYASVPQKAAEELKELIRTAHQNGIEVIPEFFFDDKTGFRLIADCLEYWAKEYHVDGFAVMARESVLSELTRLPLFSRRKLIGGWFPENALSNRKNKKMRMIAECNDGFMIDSRRFLRSDDDMTGSFLYRVRSNPSDHAMINYITHHDGFTMYDLVSYDRKHNDANGHHGTDGSDYNCSWNCGEEGPVKSRKIRELRTRQMKNAYALMLLAQGTPMLLAGDEFANSQEGNNNPYCHDSLLSWTDWDRKRREKSLTEYVKQMIAFRKSHGMLHRAAPLKGSDTRACGYPDFSVHGTNAWYTDFKSSDHHLGCMYAQEYAGEEGLLYVIYNFHWDKRDIALPQPPKNHVWKVTADTSRKQSFATGEDQTRYEHEKSITVSARTVLILETEKQLLSADSEDERASDLGEDKRPF